MSQNKPNYTKYSYRELEDALANIDRKLWPERVREIKEQLSSPRIQEEKKADLAQQKILFEIKRSGARDRLKGIYIMVLAILLSFTVIISLVYWLVFGRKANDN